MSIYLASCVELKRCFGFCPQTVAFYDAANEFWQKWQVYGMKSPDTSASCWEIWAKEQPVTDLYPVSMILIKTLWRSGGLPVLVESKSLPVFCTWFARNQLLHNVDILGESGFNFKLFMARGEVEEVPGEILMDWRISSFRVLQLRLKSNWQYDFLLFHLYANCISMYLSHRKWRVLFC